MTRGFSLIVATDDQLGIGKDGNIPWRLPSDMAFFKATTLGDGSDSNAVIMGRVTWESIPAKFRPLPGRRNIVLSRSLSTFDGAERAASLGEALDATESAAARFVIGGQRVYEEALAHPDCQEVFLTRVGATFECDRFFPELPAAFELSEVLRSGSDGDLAFRIELWRRGR